MFFHIHVQPFQIVVISFIEAVEAKVHYNLFYVPKIMQWHIRFVNLSTKLFSNVQNKPITALNIKLLESLAQGASRFEKLLAPRKIYWPPFFPDRRLYS